jgi:hypothetical protein
MPNLLSPETPFTVWHQLEGNEPAIQTIKKSVQDYGTLPSEVLEDTELCELLANTPTKALRWIKSCSAQENHPHHFCPVVHWDQGNGQGLVVFIPNLSLEELNRETLFA